VESDSEQNDKQNQFGESSFAKVFRLPCLDQRRDGKEQQGKVEKACQQFVGQTGSAVKGNEQIRQFARDAFNKGFHRVAPQVC